MDKLFASTGSRFGALNKFTSPPLSAPAKTSQGTETADAGSESNNKNSDINKASSVTPASSLISVSRLPTTEAEGLRAPKRPRTDDESAKAAEKPEPLYRRGDCCVYETAGIGKLLVQTDHAKYLERKHPVYSVVLLGKTLNFDNICFISLEKHLTKTRYNLDESVQFSIGSKTVPIFAVVKNMRLVDGKVEYELDCHGSSFVLLEEDINE